MPLFFANGISTWFLLLALGKMDAMSKKAVLHAYLLLEVLIALSLITLCILPFSIIPTRMLRKEARSLQRIALQHIGEQTYALIKERLHRREIPWKQLAQPKGKKILLFTDSVGLPIQEFA